MAGDSDSVLVIGAGYMGAVLGEVALEQDLEVTLADNWRVTERDQLADLEEAGARIETADIRDARDVERLIGARPRRVYLLAAQASRIAADRDPDYTEETNTTGARRVAQTVAQVGADLVYASSLNVYGPAPEGDVTPDRPYGHQRDLAHLSKIYAEACLSMYAERAGFSLSILRFGIVYGPSPVEHAEPEHQTVVDKFRRLVAAGETPPLDDGGGTTIGVVHVEDTACIMLDEPAAPGISVANVAAETVTVADVARLARGEPTELAPACSFATPFHYRYRLADYMASATAS